MKGAPQRAAPIRTEDCSMPAIAPLAAGFIVKFTGWGLLLYAIVYLIPAVVAAVRRGRFWVPAIVVDVLLAWTLVGWVVAMVLAVFGPEQRSQPVRG
jgi:hypothetical protein